MFSLPEVFFPQFLQSWVSLVILILPQMASP